MGMDMDEVRMILAVRALRKLINKSDRGDGDELVIVDSCGRSYSRHGAAL